MENKDIISQLIASSKVSFIDKKGLERNFSFKILEVDKKAKLVKVQGLKPFYPNVFYTDSLDNKVEGREPFLLSISFFDENRYDMIFE